jgi:hypothetical protein
VSAEEQITADPPQNDSRAQDQERCDHGNHDAGASANVVRAQVWMVRAVHETVIVTDPHRREKRRSDGERGEDGWEGGEAEPQPSTMSRQ